MKNKLTALIAIWILILSLTATAYAAEDKEELLIPDADLYGSEIVLADGRVAFVDASYTDVISPEELLSEQTAPRPKLKQRASASSPYAAEDIQGAGEYLREQLKNRTGTIQFQIPCETESDLDTIRKQCWAAAFIHTRIGDEGDYLRKNMGGYGGLQSWQDGIATFTLNPTYYTTLEQEQDVTVEVDRLISEFAFSDGTSDYEKVRAIYDYICRNVVYDESPDDGTTVRFTSYGALVKKSSVCQGYAISFYRLALESGLNCRYVSGYATSSGVKENHGWNIVEVDGSWYYLDSTWDASRIQDNRGYLYLLRGSKTGEFPHIAGKDSEGHAVDLPEEHALLSVDSFALPFDILQMPESKTVQWGDPIYFRVAAIGQKVTYKWTITLGNGSQASSTSYSVGLGTVNAANRNTLDGTTLRCVITDEVTGTKVDTGILTLTVRDPVAELKGYTLSFDGDIAMNFYMQLSEDVLQKEDAHMHFTIPGETEKVVDVPVSEAVPRNFTVDGEKVTYYKFTAGVAAKDMTQPIHAEFYYSDSYKTVDQYYEVKDYADYIQKHPESYSDKAIAMVQAMLNYGGYAQTNFSYHTNEMANADLEDTELPEVKIPAENAYRISGNLEGAAFKGARLVLRTNTIIRMYFALEGDTSDYTVTVEGQKVTPTSSSLGENWVQVEIPAVPAGKLDRFYAVKITKSGFEDILAVDYCAYSNIKSVVESPSGFKESEVNMLKALYVFGEKTKAYFQK